MAKRRRRKSGNGPLIGTLIILLLVLAILGVLIWKGGLLGGGTAHKTVTDGPTDGFKMHYVGSSDDEETADAESGEAGAEAGTDAESGTAKEPEPLQQLSGEGVYSTNALMVRLSDGAVAFEKASTDKMYPASMTKIMTCILALENISDLDSQITIKQEYIDAYYSEGASRAGFEAGETVTVRDVLYGVMLPSGAEACMAVCDRVAGSEEEFVKLMNQKAEELGLKNTHFTNPVGMHSEDHYSTCADFIEIQKYCLKNDDFRTIMTTREYTTSKTDQHPSGITLNNTSFLHIPSTTFPNGAEFEGGKTGYTSEALTCLVSLAKYGDDEFIMVTAHGGGTSHPNIEDAITLYSRLGTSEVAGTEGQASGSDAGAADAAA